MSVIDAVTVSYLQMSFLSRWHSYSERKFKSAYKYLWTWLVKVNCLLVVALQP